MLQERRGKMIESGAKIIEWIMIISNSILIFLLTYKLYQIFLIWIGLEVQRNPVIDRWAWRLIFIGYMLLFLCFGLLILVYYWVFLVLFLVIGFLGRKTFAPFVNPFVWIGKYPWKVATILLKGKRGIKD
jgi:hypothetical protein